MLSIWRKLELCPWEFGFSNLGGRLVMSKQGRDAFSARMALPAIPEGGALPQLLEDRRSEEKDEAAVDPPSSSSSSSSRRGSVQSQNGDVSNMRTGGSGEAGYATPPVKSSEDQDMLRSPAPLQPETVAGLSDPDNTATGLSENPRPAKQPRQGLHSAAEVVQRSGTPSSGLVCIQTCVFRMTQLSQNFRKSS